MVLSATKQENTYAEVKDVVIYNVLEQSEVLDKLYLFLSDNGLEANDVDALVLGYNGDVVFDGYYALIGESLREVPQLYYKHLSGEYNTASSFGLWAAAHMLRMQLVPDVLKINSFEHTSFKNIILYNQYKGKDHSFTLISKA